MQLVRSLILSCLLILGSVGVAFADDTRLIASSNFNDPDPPSWYLDSTGCDHVPYGGFGDSGSLILLGGGQCWMGPFPGVAAAERVGLGFMVISADDVGAGSYQWSVVRASDNAVLASSVVRTGPYYQNTLETLASTQGVGDFYIVFTHVSGVSFHIDQIFVYGVDWSSAPTATPTATPAPADTPTPVPTATPTPTATNTPVPAPTNTPVPTATPIPWDEWILPQEDMFDPLKDLRETVTGKEPFYTLQRFYEQRDTLQRGISSRAPADDLSAYPSQAQSYFWVLIDFLDPLLPYLQIIFDAFVVVMFWQYVTRRITT